MRLEFVGNLMVYFAALFAVLGRDTFNGAQVGLAISYSLSVNFYKAIITVGSRLELNSMVYCRSLKYSTGLFE